MIWIASLIVSVWMPVGTCVDMAKSSSSSSNAQTVSALAREWLRLDKNPKTRSEIVELLKEEDYPELDKLLGSRLTFGTAGLRARMGAGFARINCLTIIQTSQGLAEYLLHEGVASGGVVIGYDARHDSKKFAEFAAAAFIAKSIPVYWYQDLVHTPMVPFGVKHLHAAAGVMVTASHNPAQDNGYKVYGSNGCQINAPVDERIAASILNNLEPVTWDLTEQASQRKSILHPVRAAYLQALEQYIGYSREAPQTLPPFVYTPMHGVGLPYLLLALAPADHPIIVKEQAEPDPDFPPVQYPNPEEDGALSLAKATADRVNVSLVVANDPDADRFAAAEKVGECWHQFTGDQVGVLVASFLRENGKLNRGDIALTTAVSSEMLSAVSENAFDVEETLTGFKWLGNRALERHAQYGYEEALGYMFPEIVCDKDGITAAIIFLRASATWDSPWTRLQQLYLEFGYFETVNTYWKSSNPAMTTAIFQQPRPAYVAGRKVLSLRDLVRGHDSQTDDHKPGLPSSTYSPMITFWLEGRSSSNGVDEADEGVRFTLRASGTEPKVKGKYVNINLGQLKPTKTDNNPAVYLECRSMDQKAARAGAVQMLKAVNEHWFDDPAWLIEDKYRSGLA